ncbi:efflux RND transporter periplasmic adaptor subunit [Stieleria sp. TO1_6]|uniref:efflux RND transporter periplasmic adaptor subunit n=1 Tax=Stieleria tagensis TaxID=2956795 RepID=UPI00209AF9F7|nr:efflux RND transporter periplasmic adaptor subunit [Stieleria tagensis]MCO8122208.1 efflux RND transporter periplasmic adaptor subunit [Stieleria tagensis]
MKAVSRAPRGTAKARRDPQQRPQGIAQTDWAKALTLVESVARSGNRQDAVVALVKQLTVEFPASKVRCGLGTTRLRRFFDSQLGWLGPASDLFRSAAAGWDEDAAPLPTRPALPGDPAPQSLDGQIGPLRLNIDDEHGLGRCVLWIDGVDLTHSDRIWLRRGLPALRAVLWQRSGGLFFQLSRWISNYGASTRVYATLASLFLVLVVIWPVSYRVRCTSVVRPSQSRVVAVPFAATLESAHVHPGDSVESGDALIELDGRPLRLERESIDAQIAQVQKERDIAMVAGRVAEAQQAQLRTRELSRQRDLLTDRLERLTVTSPIDGVVVSGDLNRSIGAPLEMGQSIVEVAPLDQMVIELEIPEYEIGYVDKGTLARVRLAAGDGEVIELPINGIYPAAELRDDQNVFVAQINVNNPAGSLRPGMRGDAIAYGPLRPWVWSILRSGWEKTLWWVGY